MTKEELEKEFVDFGERHFGAGMTEKTRDLLEQAAAVLGGEIPADDLTQAIDLDE